MEQTVKKKIGVRDIMTIAAMMVINFAIAMVIAMCIRDRTKCVPWLARINAW